MVPIRISYVKYAMKLQSADIRYNFYPKILTLLYIHQVIRLFLER